MCQEGCVYNGFDRDTNKIKCNCNNNNINNITDEFNNEVSNLFSNSNLKVLKCFYLNKNIKLLLKNYGNYVFMFCELSEIFLVFYFLFQGFFPLMKNLKYINKHIYYKSNKNPPKKKIRFDYSNEEDSISKKLNYSKEKNIFKLNNIIIYNYKKLKKNYTNEEINELNFNESLIIDKRNLFITYFNFLKYSHFIFFYIFYKN